MQITFLIGNGFDLSLGLKTDYGSFLNWFTKEDKIDESKITDPEQRRRILKLKNRLQDAALKENWADLEIAMGEDASNYQDGCSEYYLDDWSYLKDRLKHYLGIQQKRINYEDSRTEIQEMIEKALLENCWKVIRPGGEDSIKNKLSDFCDHFGCAINVAFVNFNYTTTLDECVTMGLANTCNSDDFSFELGAESGSFPSIMHIHGTLDEPVFGVNDSSQLKKFGDEITVSNSLIKPQFNDWRDELRSNQVKDAIHESDIVYIYGMSLGATDAIWWNRIWDFMSQDKNVLTIISKHTETPDEITDVRKCISASQEVIERFGKYCPNDIYKSTFEKKIKVSFESNTFSLPESVLSDRKPISSLYGLANTSIEVPENPIMSEVAI